MSIPHHRAVACTLMGALILYGPRLALAQQAVEFFPGPVVSSNKIISMGGAYTGIAMGADAHLINPAAFAQRHSPRRASWFTGDWALTWFNDAPNTESEGESSLSDSFHLDYGLHLNFGRFGIGLHGYGQSFAMPNLRSTEDTNTALDVWLGYLGLGMGWSFWKDQLTVGVFLGDATLNLTETTANKTLAQSSTQSFTSSGSGPMVGLHLKLDGQPWQVGIRARREVRGALTSFTSAFGEAQQGQVVIPAQLSLGGAVTIPLGERFTRPLLLSTDLVLTGKTARAVTIQGFVLGTGEVTGNETTLAPHVGAELEVVDNRLRLRAGSYWEPDRARGEVGRPHATLGGEVRVHVIWDWRIDACLDLAPGYVNWGIGIGFWTASPKQSALSTNKDDLP